MAIELDRTFRKLFKGGGILFAGLVVQLGLSFLAKVVIARILGPIDYGAVSIGVTILGLLSTLSLLGLDSGVGRYLPRFDSLHTKRGIIISAFQISIPISIFIGLIVAGFADYIAIVGFHDPEVSPFIRIFGLTIPFASVMKLAVGTIRGTESAVPKVVVQNLSPPISRFLALIVAVVLGLGSLGVAAAYALAYVVAAAIGILYVFRETPFLSSIETPRMHHELLLFSAPLVVTAAMAFVLSDVDTFMIGYFSSTAEVGVYNVVYPIAQLLTTALGSFGFLFMPIISRLDSEGASDDMHRLYQVVTKWVFMATLPVFLVIALFPTMTITITFGEEYAVGAATLSILAVAFFSHAIAGPNANVLTSIGQTRLIMWDNVIIATLNFLLNFLLIPRYGYFGAGVATAISYISLNIIYSTQLYRETGIHPFSEALVRPGIIALLLVGIEYWVIRTFFEITLPLLIVMFFVFIFLYSFVILHFGGIEREEVMLVLSFEERFGVDLGPVKAVVNRIIR